MRILKLLPLVVICLSLAMGNIAHAANPCCAPESKAAKLMDQDMSCHKKVDNKADSGNHKIAAKCNSCMYCAAVVTLPEQRPINKEATTLVLETFSNQILLSHQPEGIFQPPRHLS